MEESIAKMLKIARMFYEDKLSKTEISRYENIPRGHVAQLLSEAEKRGIVEIQIHEIDRQDEFLQLWFETYFSLETCCVSPTCGAAERTEALLSDYVKCNLKSRNKKGICIGIDEKRLTYRAVRQYLKETPKNVMKMVSLTGTEEQSVKSDMSFARGEEQKHLWLPYSLEANSEEDKELYYQSSVMRRFIDKWENMNMAIISADNSGEFQYQYESDLGCLKLMKWLLENPQQSVGRFLGRSMNVEGKILDIPRNRCVLAISPEQFQKTERVAAIAAGKNNLFSIIGMLNTGFVTDLYIDEITAKLLKDIVSVQRG